MQLLRGALGKRQRFLGILKTGDEFTGVVRENEFEIWERQARALHAHGQIRGRRGGSRLEMRIDVTPRTWVLAWIFAVLYAVTAVALVAQDPTVVKGLVAIAGAVAIVVTFLVGAARQRAALRAFVEQLYRDTENAR